MNFAIFEKIQKYIKCAYVVINSENNS